MHTCLLLPCQAEVKLLQRLNRVLLSAPADSILAGMHQHFVQAVHKQGLSALGEVAASHKDIRAAFEGQLARDGMGVIQHALSLHQALERKQVGIGVAQAVSVSATGHPGVG